MGTLKLADGPEIIIDNIGKDQWESLIQEFEDSNVRQTWSYGEVMWGENNISRILLRKGNEILALAQLKLLSIPHTNIGVASLIGGPLWRNF
jgi:hypothetical protein